ncbi:MAG: NTPase [Candidatus Hydrogenedentes bacterium]|nr:NTPase [Candidatus Hydrogenedentota bacterium]
MSRNILLTGVPGVGKTQLVRRVLAEMDAKIGGFYTEEIRERGKRVGFNIKTFDGRAGILAHVNHKGPHRVGKYGVNIGDLEQIAAGSVMTALQKDDLVVIDELGRMELYSAPFQQVVTEALDSEKPVLGTIQVRRNPFLDCVRARDDVRLVQVTADNRDALVESVTRDLTDLLQGAT